MILYLLFTENCPAITPTSGLSLSTQNINYTTKVVFECDYGYEVVGEAALECLDGGSWNGSVPTCTRKFGEITKMIPKIHLWIG